MKFCSKCGNELIDDAVICTKCGCMVEPPKQSPQVKSRDSKFSPSAKTESNFTWIPLLFGILSLFATLSMVLSGFVVREFFVMVYNVCFNLGLHSFAILSVISAIKYFKAENKTMPMLGLVFGCISILANIIFTIIFNNFFQQILLVR